MAILEAFLINSNKLKGLGKYYKCGQGSPIILLHGFAENYEIWNNIFLDLSKQYTVIIPEIPACGNATSFKAGFTMELIADYLNDILIQENIKQTVLFGHSMGGYASMAFAEKYPNKLLGLSLVHSSAQEDTQLKKEVRETAINFIRKNGKDLFIKTLLPKLYSSTQGTYPDFKKHQEMANSYTDEQIIACYKAMLLRKDRVNILSDLKYPIQFIGGKDDASVHYQDTKRQSTQCRRAYLTIFEGIAHTSMHENPALLLKTILGFLDDIKQTKYS